MPIGPGLVVKPRGFIHSPCGHVVAILLIAYGVLNTFLFIKFTPVYSATECGDQEGEMDNFELGREIRVGLKIQVTCWNPNGYGVQIMTSTPGRVWVGKDRKLQVGELSLDRGSTLPAKSSGDIHVHMDAKLSQDSSVSLVPHFLEDAEIPMFLELQFEVAVSVSILGQSLGITAPFKKRCGMVMAGVLQNTGGSRLGPMICRNSWAELRDLPHVGEAPEGKMSFSAAQMDPDRIRMGEAAKNVSIIGIGGFCYIMGFFMLYKWCARPRGFDDQVYDQVGPLDQSGRRWCARGYSGNLVEPHIDKTMPMGSNWQPRSCFRGSSGNLIEPAKPVVDDSLLAQATRVFGGRVGMRPTTQYERERELVAWEERGPRPACSCLLQPVWNFMSCGKGGGCTRTDRRAPLSPNFGP